MEYILKLTLFGYDEESGELSLTERIRLTSINNPDAIEEFQEIVNKIKALKE